MSRFPPSTRLGRTACWLALGFVAWWVLNMVLYWASLAGLSTGAARPAVIALSWLGMATGVATGVVASLAILLRKERGVSVFLCLLPGLFAVAFLLGELLVPH